MKNLPFPNYFQFLEVPYKATDSVVYKAFVSKLKNAETVDEKRECLVAYAIMQQPLRKFYDLVFYNLSAGREPDPKYVRVIKNRRDQLMGNVDDEDIRRAKQITRSFPWGAFLGEALGLLLESGISHLNKGPLVLILSLALLVSGWTSDVQALLILGAVLFLLGVFISAEGLKRWRMESLDEIFRKANSNP
ncbi:MAG: hypothetical protein SchgKO_11190 [Schleiferiaceae bacterium]